MLLTCSNCDKKLKVPDTVVSKKVRCPHCKESVAAPKLGEDAKEAIRTRPAVTKTPKPKPAPEEDGAPKPTLKAKRKPVEEDEDAPADAMRCARCDSARIEPLPANAFSRRPGFLCKKCGARMRPAASTGFYLFAIVLGVFGVLCGLGLATSVLFADQFPLRAVGGALVLALAGVSVIGFAFNQMRLPVPRNAPPFRWGLWIGMTILFLFIAALVIGGCLFGFAYFLHEML
jgi:hypothetical protein